MGCFTYEDVQLAGEAVGDVAEQELALVAHGDVADGAGDAESPGFPLLQALAELGFLPGARVHGRPERRQLLHHRAPVHQAPTGETHLKPGRDRERKGAWRGTYPMPRVPPVTSAVLPWRDHLPALAPMSSPAAISSSS